MRASVMWIGSRSITIKNAQTFAGTFFDVYLLARALACPALHLAQQLQQNGCIKLRGVLQAPNVLQVHVYAYKLFEAPVFFAWLHEGRNPQVPQILQCVPRSNCAWVPTTVRQRVSRAIDCLVARELTPFSLQLPWHNLFSTMPAHTQAGSLRLGNVADRRGCIFYAEAGFGKTFAAIGLMRAVPVPCTVILVRDCAMKRYWLRMLKRYNPGCRVHVLTQPSGITWQANRIIFDSLETSSLEARKLSVQVIQVASPARVLILSNTDPTTLRLAANVVNAPVLRQQLVINMFKAENRLNTVPFYMFVHLPKDVDPLLQLTDKQNRCFVLNAPQSVSLDMYTIPLSRTLSKRSVKPSNTCAICMSTAVACPVRTQCCQQALCLLCSKKVLKCPYCRKEPLHIEAVARTMPIGFCKHKKCLLPANVKPQLRLMRLWAAHAKPFQIAKMAQHNRVLVISGFHTMLLYVKNACAKRNLLCNWAETSTSKTQVTLMHADDVKDSVYIDDAISIVIATETINVPPALLRSISTPCAHIVYLIAKTERLPAFV